MDLMTAARRSGLAAVATCVLSSFLGCPSGASPALDSHPHKEHEMSVGYLEIVTPDVDSACALYESLHGLSFGPKDEALGNARAARKPDGTLVAIRAPLAAHEGPIVRAYLAVDDIHKAAKAAEERGATIAYPPTKQGEHGTFAIVIQDDVQHGLWQP